MGGPVDLYIINGVPVDKAAFRADDKTAKRRNMANASTVRSADLSGQYAGIYVQNTQRSYDMYVGGGTPVDDMTDESPFIQDSEGNIFATVSSVPSPTVSSLGGVYASSAVANQFVTGVATDGTLLRAQPSASDLSNGVEGTGAVVLKSYADGLIAANDAFVPKGVIDCSANPNYPAADAGWTYRVSVAGKIGGASGVNVEAGDILLCLTDGTVSGNQATVGASWGVIQVNIDGAVTLTGTQTLTNKTLTAPVINSPTGIVKGDVGLGNVDNTSNATERAAIATLISKTIDTGSNTFKLNGAAFGTATQATAALNGMVGDTGSGGTKGLVPAPGAGDASAGKFLKADGSWAVPAGGGGGGSLPDDVRQNLLSTTAYQSKSFAEYRRIVLLFATGFKGASDALNGINTGSSSNYTVNSGSGYVAPLASATLVSGATGTVINSNMTGGGGASASFDGTTSQGQAAGTKTTGAANSTNGFADYLGKNWGGGTTKTISRFTVYGPNDANWLFGGGASAVKLRGSSNGSSWTDLTTSIALPSGFSSVVDVSSGIDVSTAYQYHSLIFQGNGANSLAVAEIVLYEGGIGNMTLVTASQTADASVGNGRVLLEIDNTTSPALNSDLTVEVTCNGGSNWSTATLSGVTSYSQGGRKIVETADTACTSGTSFAARVKTLNSKMVPIYVLALSVH